MDDDQPEKEVGAVITSLQALAADLYALITALRPAAHPAEELPAAPLPDGAPRDVGTDSR